MWAASRWDAEQLGFCFLNPNGDIVFRRTECFCFSFFFFFSFWFNICWKKLIVFTSSSSLNLSPRTALFQSIKQSVIKNAPIIIKIIIITVIMILLFSRPLSKIERRRRAGQIPGPFLRNENAWKHGNNRDTNHSRFTRKWKIYWRNWSSKTELKSSWPILKNHKE